MYATCMIILALFISATLAALLAPTPSISDPTITPAPRIPIELLRKQNNDRFIGWLSVDGEWTTRTCEIGGTYYQSGEYWRCCATTLAGCNVPIGCVAGSVVYSFESGTQSLGTYACSEVYTELSDYSFSICNTGFMFENSADSDPVTNIFCGVSSLNWSYFRVRPAEATSTAESSTSPSSRLSTSASTTGPSTQTQTPEPKKEESKAWIAGAVVGPVVGLALLGALMWFCLFRKKKNKAVPQSQPSMQQAQPGVPAPYGAPSYPGSTNFPPSVQYHDSQNPSVMAPAGVASHNSWAPQSPTSQGSQSPHPPQSPYGPLAGQQWQPPPQNQQYHQSPVGSSPQSLPPQNTQPFCTDANKQSGVLDRPFSAELESVPQQQR